MRYIGKPQRVVFERRLVRAEDHFGLGFPKVEYRPERGILKSKSLKLSIPNRFRVIQTSFDSFIYSLKSFSGSELSSFLFLVNTIVVILERLI